MRDVLHRAMEAARAGGDVVRSQVAEIRGVRSKRWAVDFVSEVDIASGESVVRSLLAADPQARVIVEEAEVAVNLGIAPGTFDDPEVWVVDPLDGTTSYLHGFPCYSVSVALLREGVPVAGAVYDAARDQMYAAARGVGATRDGHALRCTSAPLTEALLATGFPYDRGAPLDRQLTVLAAFLRTPVHGIRRDGSAAIDCCHVAAGACDGFWEYALQPWDTAAGVVIAEEAGARATDIDGAPWTPRSAGVVIANPALHARMLEVIREARVAPRLAD